MKVHSIEKLLSENPYPGRGIILGRSEDNKRAIMIYFIMGRSENSRNRVFEKTSDGIRTKAFDPEKLTDPSLVIYNAVRVLNGHTIVTNGDHTDTVYEYLLNGKDMHKALQTREYEPDAPNYTPRIAGLIDLNGNYILSILKSASGNPKCCVRNFYEYSSTLPGVGHFISTYKSDGDPIPSFEGEPIPIEINAADGLESLAKNIWNSLNKENKVAIYAREIDTSTGAAEDMIINKINAD